MNDAPARSAFAPDATPDFSWHPPAESGINLGFVEANGLRFEVAECGDAASPRLALCLHGFPELHYSWRHQMPLLAARGYRVWAANMRGYGASSRPEGVNAYRLDTLIDDVAALIDASGAREVMLVAHDWGALVAWHFAIRKLRPLARLVIMNVPHPKCSEREIRTFSQLRKSWYIFLFQLPWLPERMLTRKDAAAIKQIFIDDPLNKSLFPPEDRQIFADAALRPGAMRAMINYYRALMRTPDMRSIGDAMVDVPTLMLWGENDVALGLRCTEGTGEWVPDLELVTFPGISHWVQQDAPEAVNAALTDWLDRRGG